MKRIRTRSSLSTSSSSHSDPNRRTKKQQRPPHTPVPPHNLSAAEFLKFCGVCNASLEPGLDTFIYKGDVAFCSSECREVQIDMDEWKEKISDMSLPNVQSQTNGNNGTTAAAS